MGGGWLTLTTEELAGTVVGVLEDWHPPADREEFPAVARDIIAALTVSGTRESALRALAEDWLANGNSRGLGDPGASTWHEAARQLLAVLDGSEPTGW